MLEYDTSWIGKEFDRFMKCFRNDDFGYFGLHCRSPEYACLLLICSINRSVLGKEFDSI